jgi:tRNA dimethylallyltransferase
LTTVNKYVVIIGGPTASGKTDLAIKIAKHFNTEIISADSRQVYKEMSIGTAKPDNGQLKKIKHHFISFKSIHEKFDAGTFEKESLALMNEYFKTKDIIVVAGGTGLYINSLINGLDIFPEIEEDIIQNIETQYKNSGIESLQNELKNLDPEYYEKVDKLNPHRLIRALSVIKTCGKSFSYYLNREKISRSFKTINLFLNFHRTELYLRINERVDKMINVGLVEEASKLYEFRNLKALQTVGYKELFDYFDGLISLEEAIELIKRNSRHYAKRQYTWFNNKGSWHEVQNLNFESIIELIYNKILEIENDKTGNCIENCKNYL